MKVIGNRLKEARKAKGMTQEELGNIVGVTPEAIGNYENEKREPKGVIFTKLLDALGVSADFILGRTDSATYIEPQQTRTRNLSYLNAPDPGTALNRALEIAQEENWTHDDLRDAIRTLADRWGFFPGGATRPATATA